VEVQTLPAEWGTGRDSDAGYGKVQAAAVVEGSSVDNYLIVTKIRLSINLQDINQKKFSGVSLNSFESITYAVRICVRSS